MQRMNPFVESNVSIIQKYLSAIITDPMATEGILLLFCFVLLFARSFPYVYWYYTGRQPWSDLADQAIDTNIDLTQLYLDDLFRLHRLLHISAPSLVSELTIALNSGGPINIPERRSTWSVGQVKPHHEFDNVGTLCTSFTAPASEQMPGEKERDSNLTCSSNSSSPNLTPQMSLRGTPTGRPNCQLPISLTLLRDFAGTSGPRGGPRPSSLCLPLAQIKRHWYFLFVC